MAETFYPFVEGPGGADTPELPGPTASARIAVYDDMAMVPRVVVIEPTDIRAFLEQITDSVFQLATQQGGDWSFMLIRELVENFIHASFVEVSISILDKGQTLVFSDQGPGIPNKQAALKPSFSSATKAMKRYIRGVGSGLPIVEEQLRLKHGTITIEDNLGHGTIVTVSLLPAEEDEPTPVATPLALGAPQVQGLTPAQGQPPYGAMAPYGSAPNGGGQPGGIQGQQPYGMYAAYPANVQPQAAPGYNPHGGTPQPYPYPGYGAPQQGSYGMPLQGGYGAAAYGAAPQGMMYGAPQGTPLSGYGTPGQPAYGQTAPYPGAPAPQPYGQPYGASTAQPGYGYNQTYAPAPGYDTAPAANLWGAPLPGAQQMPPAALAQPNAAIDAHAPLNNQQRDIVRLFARMEKIGPAELQEQLGLSNPTGSRRLADLAAAGYIAKSGQKYALTSEGQLMLSYLMNSGV